MKTDEKQLPTYGIDTPSPKEFAAAKTALEKTPPDHGPAQELLRKMDLAVRISHLWEAAIRALLRCKAQIREYEAGDKLETIEAELGQLRRYQPKTVEESRTLAKMFTDAEASVSTASNRRALAEQARFQIIALEQHFYELFGAEKPPRHPSWGLSLPHEVVAAAFQLGIDLYLGDRWTDVMRSAEKRNSRRKVIASKF
jgi:hypothetical protein